MAVLWSEIWDFIYVSGHDMGQFRTMFQSPDAGVREYDMGGHMKLVHDGWIV